MCKKSLRIAPLGIVVIVLAVVGMSWIVLSFSFNSDALCSNALEDKSIIREDFEGDRFLYPKDAENLNLPNEYLEAGITNSEKYPISITCGNLKEMEDKGFTDLADYIAFKKERRSKHQKPECVLYTKKVDMIIDGEMEEVEIKIARMLVNKKSKYLVKYYVQTPVDGYMFKVETCDEALIPIVHEIVRSYEIPNVEYDNEEHGILCIEGK